MMSYTLVQSQSWITGPVSWTVCDKVDDIDFHYFELEAMIRSGDYVKALSSMLDTISYDLRNDPVQCSRLENIIDQLTYVDRHYQITPRKNQKKT